jgi:hypothetical protein
MQFEDVPTGVHPPERARAEVLRVALNDALDAALRSLESHRVAERTPLHRLESGVEFEANGYTLAFKLQNLEPLRCRIFEQFATDVIQCVAWAHLHGAWDLPLRALLPDLYEKNVVLFWGVFTKHAPASVYRTKLAMRSPSSVFEKILDQAEYRVLVTHFDAVLESFPAANTSIEALPIISVRESERPWTNEVYQQLANAASTQNEDAFVQALCGVDQDSVGPDDYLDLIRLALAAGAHHTARELAATASARYPEDIAISRFTEALRPPELSKPSHERNAHNEAAQSWLRENAARYLGQWVALRGDELVASADSLQQLRKAAGSLRGLFVARV